MEKYRRKSDKELEEMTQGQRLAFMESETEKAHRNQNKIAAPRRLAGSVLGAATGVIGSKALKASGTAATTAGLAGGLLGYEAGDWVGKRKAAKKGHSPAVREERLARRLDRIARKRGEPDTYAHAAYQNRMLRKISGDTERIREEQLLGGLG